MGRSELFRAFNVMRAAARRGYIDPKRLNRSLGIAQRKEPRPYVTTLESCSCPDFQYRRGPCKHIYALAMLEISHAA